MRFEGDEGIEARWVVLVRQEEKKEEQEIEGEAIVPKIALIAVPKTSNGNSATTTEGEGVRMQLGDGEPQELPLSMGLEQRKLCIIPIIQLTVNYLSPCRPPISRSNIF
jgi:hypothetical protein